MKTANRAVILFIVALSALYAANIQWGKDNWKDIIEADGRGYYAYLPAVFIYHDLNFGFYDSITQKYPVHPVDYRVQHNGKNADKYFVGTSIAMMPVFIVAHLFQHACGLPADGYSKTYHVAMNIAGLLYLFLGLFYLKRLLQLYDFSGTRISFVLIVITFATNLFYYAAIEPAMSHVYSFFFITALIYCLRSFFIQPSYRYVFIAAVLCGMIFLIRPVNILVLLSIPFIAGSKTELKNAWVFLFSRKNNLLIAVFLFFAICFIQPLIYWIQTGSFWFDSYPGENFNWTHPHPISFLFSFKKGLFVYTPVAIFGLLGLTKLYKADKFRAFALTGFFIILLYVLSSWWNWWYGGSFSSRPCVEYYSLLALLLCYSFDMMKRKWMKGVFSGILVLLIALCQLEVYQYRYYYIHWEKMDKEHFCRIFLRVDLIGKENPNADLLK